MNKYPEAAETPTHRAIAAAAGVAPSTVSLALRQDPRVKARTANRIRSVAKQMGYRANPSVSMWMAHVRATRNPKFQEVIAYIRTIPRDHTFRKCVPFERYRNGAVERANRLGYQLRDFEWHDQGMTSKRLRTILDAQGIRGLIFEYSDFEESHQYTIDFDWTGLTAISLVGRPADSPIHNVSSNYFDGTMLAYKELIALGYSRIGMSLHMFSDQSMDFELSGGFLCAQSLHPNFARIPIHNTQVVQGWDRKGFCDWCKKYKPDAIVSPDSEILSFIKHMGLRVPEDIGFANLVRRENSEVSGVEHHPEHIASVAVDLLSSLLHNNETGQAQFVRRELLEPTWYPGATVRKQLQPNGGESRQNGALLRVYSRHRDWQTPGQDHDVVFNPIGAASVEGLVGSGMKH